MHTLSIGYSPCPNDTFIFNALIHALVPCPGIELREQLEDVETLNRLALERRLDVSKISYHALGHLRRDYVLLRCGGALGRGCGPLLICRAGQRPTALRATTILIPGELTTANLLLQLHLGGCAVRSVPFEQIMPRLAAGEADAGVIIHESRFTYADHGFEQIIDLGQWWEQLTGLPIPLGGIIARRDLPTALILTLEDALRASIDYAYTHPDAAADYISSNAQELSNTVTKAHIDLYVNEFSRDLGDEGLAAVSELLKRAEHAGLIEACALPLLAEHDS